MPRADDPFTNESNVPEACKSCQITTGQCPLHWICLGERLAVKNAAITSSIKKEPANMAGTY